MTSFHGFSIGEGAKFLWHAVLWLVVRFNMHRVKNGAPCTM